MKVCMETLKKLASCQKGSFQTVTIQKKPELQNGFNTLDIVKEMTFQARTGISYNGMAQTKKARSNGDSPPTPNKLPWGKWYIEDYVIEHKGEFFFRIFGRKKTFNTKWFLNGIEVSKTALKPYLKPAKKDYKKGQKWLTMAVKVQHIKSVG